MISRYCDKNNDKYAVVAILVLAVIYPLHSRVDTLLGSLNMSVGDGLIFMIFLAAILQTIIKKSDYKIPILMIPVFAIIGVSITTIGSNALLDAGRFEFGRGISETVKILGSAMYMISTYILLYYNTEKKLYAFILATYLVSIIVSLFTIYQANAGIYRPSGPFTNPNLLADYLVFSIVTTLLLIDIQFESGNKHTAIVILMSLLLPSIALLQTQSRSAIGAIGIAISVIIAGKFLIHGFDIRVVTSYATIVGTSVIPIGTIISLQDWGILSRFSDSLDGQAIGDRPTLWSRGIHEIIDQPLLGVGIGQYQAKINTQDVYPDGPHNTMIRFLTETGIIGLAVLVILTIMLIKVSIYLISERQHVEVLYILAYLIAAIANSMFHDIINFRSFWIALGIICAYSVFDN